MSVVPSINGHTRLMAVVGDPIRQARSPAVLTEIFAARNAGIICFPLHVTAVELATAWAGLKAMANVVGFGVTVPHKRAALAFCDSLDPVAERLGAVNLVRREADGSFRGYQFDGLGFVGGLRAQGIDPFGRRCQIIGAGGAATAVAFALADAGVTEIAILNRDAAKAEILAAAVNDARGHGIARAGQLALLDGCLVVNATSLGMRPDDPLPFDTRVLGPRMIVADVIAQPDHTPLLIAARNQGALVHSGLHMVKAQAPVIVDCICDLWRAQD